LEIHPIPPTLIRYILATADTKFHLKYCCPYGAKISDGKANWFLLRCSLKNVDQWLMITPTGNPKRNVDILIMRFTILIIFKG
jgi:hypothetical protein